MADSPKCSPRAKWKRPSDVMKMRRKKKSVGTQNQNPGASMENSGKGEPSNTNRKKKGFGKRKNPFGCRTSPRKRSYLSASDSDSTGEFLKSLDLPLFKDTKSEASFEEVFGSPQEIEVKCSDVEDQKEITDQNNVKSNPVCPIDWSIKTRLRFLSAESFNWCMNLKSTEESAGMKAFVRCQAHEKFAGGQDFRQNSSARSQFQQCLLSWIHPSIPWMKLFPRLAGDVKQSNKTSFAHNQEIQDSLLSDWSESFHSLFHMLRSRHCPYFYLCLHQFTVLFRAAGIAGYSRMSALITPSTRGLREALKNQGIEFIMPLADASNTSCEVNKNHDTKEQLTRGRSEVKSEDISDRGDVSSGEENDDDNAETESDILESDSGASSWLQSMGLDKTSFPSLEPHKVKLQQDKTVKVDHRLESLIQVEGVHTQALFNFLLNSKSTVAISGPQAGIPPTILAPVAFHGATLRSLKVKHRTVQQYQNGKVENLGNVEITGPILPHNAFHLCRLFQQTQGGGFTVSCNTYDATVPFNTATNVEELENEQVISSSLEDCGLQQDCLKSFMQPTHLGTLAIRDLKYQHGLYNWNL
ncbi:protein downstream neighbor of son homolog [Ptychodera flava]|uniref:protein downstream neighbor of son homolog n=1 Tax=Ptychodera flava TaxID=63121 RepID=UPI003969D0B3